MQALLMLAYAVPGSQVIWTIDMPFALFQYYPFLYLIGRDGRRVQLYKEG